MKKKESTGASTPGSSSASDPLHGEPFNSLLGHAHDLITIIRPDGYCAYASPSVKRILGYVESSLTGKYFLDLIHPDDTEKMRSLIVRVTETIRLPISDECRVKHADGRWVLLECVGTNQLPNPSIAGIVLNSREITDRRNALAALREVELKFKALADSSPSAIFIWQDDAIKYVNPAAKKLTGYTSEEFEGMKFWEIIHPEHREEARERGQARLRGDDVPVHNRFKVMTKSGEERWADVHAVLIEFNGKPAVLGTAFDVTDYKKTEDELSRKASELQAIFMALPDLFFRFDRDGTILESLAGNTPDLLMPREQFIGKNIREVVPPYLADLTLDAIHQVLSGNTSVCLEYPLTIDGREEFFEARFILIAGNQVISIVRKISEKKKNEIELLKAQKLDSIGLLAGGIAHDFNNILTAILGNISLARIYAPEGKKLHAKLDEAEKSIDRARDLTRQLLTFSRGGAPVKKPMHIGALLSDTSKFTLSGSTVKCRFIIAEDLWPVEIDEGQIGQVINNIIINSIQAMPAGGTITVAAENTTMNGITPGRQGVSVLPGDYLLITFTDQGTGIPAEYLGRIFEPYFSLKKDGTGLGLATSYSIIKRHRGYIDAESKPGHGTTIRIHLPATHTATTPGPPRDHNLEQGAGRILVMDDEGAILEVCCEMLQRLGYHTETACDGSEAIEKYRSARDRDPFRAVILDLTVRSGMGGRECVGEILTLDPGARVLVSSGYSDDPIMSEYRRYGFSGVITKPYDIAELGHALHLLFTA